MPQAQGLQKFRYPLVDASVKFQKYGTRELV